MNIDKFDEFDEINEVFIDSKKKLRDSVHDIVVKLKSKEEISYGEICKKLKDEYNINISVGVFGKIIENWYIKDSHIIFKKKDKKWLDPWVYRKTIEGKVKIIAVLGKGKRKADVDEREERWSLNKTKYNINMGHYNDINDDDYYNMWGVY